jgi:predicted nucleic acid-binding protein
MSYLIDTNTISEMRKTNCNPNVKACIDVLPQDDIYISVVSLGEIMKGIEKTTDNEKKAKLSTFYAFFRFPLLLSNNNFLDLMIQ